MFKLNSGRQQIGSWFVASCFVSLFILQVIAFRDGRSNVSAVIATTFNSESEMQRGQAVAVGVKQKLAGDFDSLPKGRHNIRWYGNARFALCSNLCGEPVDIEGVNDVLEYVYLDVTHDNIKVGVPEKFVSHGGISPSELEGILNTLFSAQLNEINKRQTFEVVKLDKIAQWR